MDDALQTGMVARVTVQGFTYTELFSVAEEYFDSFFSDMGWEWMGSMMQPHTFSEAFADDNDRPEQWVGTFYAKAVPHAS